MRFWFALGLLALPLVAACTQTGNGTTCSVDMAEPAPDLVGAPTPNKCTENLFRDQGAVVVRWRVHDAQVGRLFSRGRCCCIPETLGAKECGSLCNESPSDCPESPGWYLSEVRLVIKNTQGVETIIHAPCTRAELTTAFCLTEGDYDMHLEAFGYRLVKGQEPKAFSPRTPPPVRRKVLPGQIVNLDAVVISVNEPPVLFDLLGVDGPNGGSDGGRDGT